MKLLVYSQSSVVAPLKFRNGLVISYHTLLDMWLLFHVEINVSYTYVGKIGPWTRHGAYRDIQGILPKRPYLPCVSMAGGALCNDTVDICDVWDNTSISEPIDSVLDVVGLCNGNRAVKNIRVKNTHQPRDNTHMVCRVIRLIMDMVFRYNKSHRKVLSGSLKYYFHTLNDISNHFTYLRIRWMCVPAQLSLWYD